MRMSDIAIVLCRPSEPGNVGAVCRAMKNMGLSSLRLAAPAPLDEATLLARAVHAEDVWRGAIAFGSLPEALAGCSLAVGTTCRRGKKRKTSMRPRELAAWLAAHPLAGPAGAEPSAAAGLAAKALASPAGAAPAAEALQSGAAPATEAPQAEAAPAPCAAVALVFGSERAGLDAEELNCCNVASHIPVSDEFPSLNLSHAVQVYAYELFLAFGGADEAHVKGEWVPLRREAADRLALEITETLAGLGFYKQPGREEQQRFLRDVISRAGLGEREGRYLKGILEKAAMLGSLKGGH